MIRIANQKYGTLTEAEFAELSALLAKGGYEVRRLKARPEGNAKAQPRWCIEAKEHLEGGRTCTTDT